MTATSITLGAYTIKGFSAFAAQFGVDASTGDQEAEVNAVVDYINKNGGFAGRQARVVFHDYNPANTTSQEAQAACTAFTEDNKVYGVVTITSSDPNLFYSCLAKRGVFASSTGDQVDRGFLAQYPNSLYMPAEINTTELYQLNVRALGSNAFFGTDAKVAAVILDLPEEHRAVEQGLIPALRALNLKLDDQAAITVGSSSQEAELNGAVLRFKDKGITNVIFGRAGGGGFMQRADAQQFYPRYALTSRQVPRALQAAYSAKILRGAMGIGWLPLNDVDANNYPKQVNPRETLCRKLMKDAGIDVSNPTTAYAALAYCDTIFLVRDALARASSLDLAGFRAAVESLGTSTEAATTFSRRFGPGLTHDGAGSYRINAYNEECKCFRYVSAVQSRAQ